MTTTPPAAPWLFTANEIAGVGVESDVICDWNARAGNDLSREPGRLLREKTRVIADNNAASRIFMTQNVGRNPARHTTNVLKCKIVGNNAAPAVGAKFDISHWSFSRRSSA